MTCKYKVKIKDIQYNYKVQMTDIQSKYKFKVFCTGYDDSEIKEKIDAMYQAWPKVSGEGETITLNDTANTTMAIDLKGNTSQETTTGINKIKLLDKSSTTTGGVTYNINNQVLTLSGTSTGVNIIINFNDITLPAGTYYFYLLRTKTTRVDISLRSTNNVMIHGANFGNAFQNTLNNKSFTLSTDTLIRSMNLWFPSGVDATDNYKVMICTASHTADEYEPYTNGASPNPDYPQDIHVVSGKSNVKVVGKNLFDINSCPILEYAFYDGKGNPVSWSGTCGIREYIKLNENSTYAIKYNGSNNFLICFYDENKTYLSQLTKPSGGNFTMPSTAKYIRFGIVTVIANVEWCQIEKGTTASDYEPYQEQSFDLDLPFELCKIGNYKDRIYPLNGKWYLEKKIGKVVLDGSESWTKSSNTNVNRYYIPGTFINTILDFNTIDLISDYFTCITQIQSDAHNIGLAKLNSTSVMINFSLSDTDFDTLEKYKTWLSTHNTTVYYVLATPTTEEITDSTLISQLEEIKEAESYSGQTNISQTNDDKPFILTATALKDLSSL